MKKKKKKNRSWFILFALALTVGLVVFVKSREDKGMAVTVTKPIRKTITEIIPANGKIQPVEEVKISSDVSGEIVELRVKEGDMVTSGTLLFRIKQDIYISNRDRTLASLNAYRAQLSRQEAQFRQTQVAYNRNKSLYEQGAISVVEYETSLYQYEMAQEQLKADRYNVESAGAALKEAEENLSKTTIYARRDGIISKLNVVQGDRVVGTSQMAGTEILRIADAQQMEVLVNVNENDIVRIRQNDTASIEVDAYPNRVFKGVVTQIANSARSSATSLDQVTNFEVKIFILPSSYEELVMDPSNNPFRPGMSASVAIQTATVYDALAIPIQCITTRSELVSDSLKAASRPGEVFEQVFVVQSGIKSHTVNLVRIQSGIQDHSHIQVMEGIGEDDLIVTGPYSAISKLLKQDSKVLIPENAKP
ncbi:MAG: efflux RND transporter periplasmic adaptor subunit [Bacteroidales bacterium]|nr:efflux RND transporter periplasmic adaptor subunit [Bacteroidales bacterium]MCL2739225.1 efflux RND transporter periplasmic adaptor subunit [Bacteroidales bacterium]